MQPLERKIGKVLVPFQLESLKGFFFFKYNNR